MAINLTYEIHERMFKYPSDPEVEIEIKKAEYKKGKYLSGNTTQTFRNHHGTHIDAPAHKFPKGKTINQYFKKKFKNLSCLMDLSERKSPYGKITKKELKKNNRIKHPNQIQTLIIYTGFCDKMSEYEGKLNREEKTNFEKKFPFLTKNAAKYISKKFPNLEILGIDSFSIDPSGSNSEAHRVLLKKDILPLETLVNLKKLKNKFLKKPFNLSGRLLNYTNADAAQVIIKATKI